MFGQDIPPGVDRVKIMALSGARGTPPCIWEGPANTPQNEVERAICKDRRVYEFFKRNRLIKQGTVTLDLRLDLYSHAQKVESVNVQGHSFLASRMRRKPDEEAGGSAGLVQALTRSHDLIETMVGYMMAESRGKDVVIGRLVGRGLKTTEQPPEQQAAAGPPPSLFDEVLDKGPKVLDLLDGIENMKDRRAARKGR